MGVDARQSGMKQRGLKQAAWKTLGPLVPRLLTQLERDPDSPWLGSFDRDFWHYKIRDFSSVILQQGALSLDALFRLDLPGNPLHGNALAEKWADAAIDFLLARQLRSGGFEEYYPFESGYPPAAFGLYAAGLVFRQRGYPEMEERQTSAVQRGCDWLLATPETQALNQEAAGLAALALCSRVPGVRVDAAALEERLGTFFRAQSSEGWFPEYGGPDLGYLCVTIDCLYDLHEATGDTRAWAAMKRAAAYIAFMFAPGGRVPAMVNSRNTDYLVPYGLARLGASDPAASACVHAMLGRLGQADHFLNATDDRYLCHYVGQSFFRSLEHLDAMCEPASLPCELGGDAGGDAGGEEFYAEAGQYVRHQGGSSLFFAGSKGGVVYVIGPDGIVDADFGWRMGLGKTPGGKRAVTHWQADTWEIAFEKGGEKAGETVLTCTSPLHAQGFAVSSPLRHAALRLLSFCFGNRLIPFLKKKLIFRASRLPIAFTRELRLGMAGMALTDTFSCLPAGVSPEPAPQASMRHVASAARFCPEELLPLPRFAVETDGDGLIARRLMRG